VKSLAGTTVKEKISTVPLIPYWELERGVRWQTDRGVFHPLEVEIGFGLGEVLLNKARTFPDRFFVGIEQNWERTWRTLKNISSAGGVGSLDPAINNVNIFFCDANVVFDYFFTERNIEHVYCLFPCPWPKPSHARHRLFQRSFLDLLNNRLVDGGSVQIVTDHQPFHEWIKEQSSGSGFDYHAEVLPARFQTKFEKKWQSQGQEYFFETRLVKSNHHDIKSFEDEPLKSFRLTAFDPRNFSPAPYCDDHCSVICKDVIYDEEKQFAVILVLVAEGELTQYFRVSIFRREDYWRVCKCEGQIFLPTPGINRAIEHIYHSAAALVTT
jgi:tRNA (guanine-N7-)-methyltransferase